MNVKKGPITVMPLLHVLTPLDLLAVNVWPATSEMA